MSARPSQRRAGIECLAPPKPPRRKAPLCRGGPPPQAARKGTPIGSSTCPTTRTTFLLTLMGRKVYETDSDRFHGQDWANARLPHYVLGRQLSAGLRLGGMSVGMLLASPPGAHSQSAQSRSTPTTATAAARSTSPTQLTVTGTTACPRAYPLQVRCLLGASSTATCRIGIWLRRSRIPAAQRHDHRCTNCRGWCGLGGGGVNYFQLVACGDETWSRTRITSDRCDVLYPAPGESDENVW